MKDVERLLKENICIFCLKHECKEKCMELQTINQFGLITHKCLNFKKKQTTPIEFVEFVRYTFYDENGKYVAIIKTKTPHYTINQMKQKFDEVKYRE